MSRRKKKNKHDVISDKMEKQQLHLYRSNQFLNSFKDNTKVYNWVIDLSIIVDKLVNGDFNKTERNVFYIKLWGY